MTRSRSSGAAARTVVVTAVTGVTPVGRTGVPRSALTTVLLPRLASPATSTRSRPWSARSRSRCSRRRSYSSARGITCSISAAVDVGASASSVGGLAAWSGWWGMWPSLS